jgi:hypothetical protein
LLNILNWLLDDEKSREKKAVTPQLKVTGPPDKMCLKSYQYIGPIGDM